MQPVKGILELQLIQCRKRLSKALYGQDRQVLNPLERGALVVETVQGVCSIRPMQHQLLMIKSPRNAIVGPPNSSLGST